MGMLQGAAFKAKQYRHKNRTTLTSANLSKAANHTPIAIPKNSYIFVDKEDAPSSRDLFIKKLRIRLEYLDREVIREVVRVAEETFAETERQTYSRTEMQERGKHKMDRATRITMRSKSNYTVEYNEEPGRVSVASVRPSRDNSVLNRQTCKYNLRQEMSSYFVKCV
jgi:hypothetical protein